MQGLTSPPPAVLVVDDTPANLVAMSAVLQPLNVRLVEARSGAEALELVTRQSFAAALLDVQMPDMDGFETARRMRELPGGRELPIVFLTAIHREESYARQGYAAGGADYITKPFDIEVVRARVRAFVDLYRQREEAHRSRYEERTRERDEMQRRLEAFERIGTAALVADDVDGFLHSLLTIFVGAADTADTVHILLRDGDELRVRASIGMTGNLPDTTSLRVGEGIGGRIAATRTELFLRDAEIRELARSKWLGARGLKALYGVPLTVGEDLIGVAYIGTTRADEFSEPDRRLFAAMAQRAAWAVSRQLDRDRAIELERAARHEAEAANRFKDELLQTVSHELRTPLNAILGWTSSIRSGAVTDVDRALSIVERNARAQARLIEDILDLSRIVRGKLELEVVPTDITHALSGAVEAVRPAAVAKGVALDLELDADIGVVAADANRIQQVIWNLLSNAIKFTPAGGRVRLASRLLPTAVRLTVTDTGEGIPAALLPHVFEAFRQGDASTTRRHGGLGLGLAIARQLVQAHGGTIRAESPGPGRGATFTVDLPAPDASPGVASGLMPAEASPAAVRLDRVKILVVDDELDALELTREVLQQHGATVEIASSASEALATLRRFLPDVLLTDIGIPVSDGYALLRSVRALPPELGGQTLAVAVTAYASADDVRRTSGAGFALHVAKPVDPTLLVRRISELLPQAQVAGERQVGATGE